jgi:hypothetical protein
MLLVVAVAACADVHGGAVELSWKLRPESGSVDLFVDCDTGALGTNPVTRMRLDWTDGSDVGFETWSCTDYHGVTGFELATGTALLSVRPECGSGSATIGTYIAPAPEERSVNVGDTVNLGAIEVFVEISNCGSASNQQECICD